MLEVAAAVIGILAAAGKVVEILGPVVSSLRNHPKNAAGVLSELNISKSILETLQKYLDDLSTSSTTRKELISVDQLVTSLTDGWLLVKELESLVVRLDNPDFALPKRMQWVWKDNEFASLLTRLQRFKLSIGVMLSILQCESDAEARQNQQELLAITKSVLQNNIQLSQRLARLEHYIDGGNSLHTRRQYSLAPTVTKSAYERDIRDSIGADDEKDLLPGETPTSLEFETDLNASRVYRRAKRDSMDYSFCSSKVLSHAWTKLSDISLSDISVISLIALPITQSDMGDSSLYEPQIQAPNTRAQLRPKRPITERILTSPENFQQRRGHLSVLALPSSQQQRARIRSSLPTFTLADHGVLSPEFQSSPHYKIVMKGSTNAQVNELTAEFTNQSYIPGVSGNLMNSYYSACIVDSQEVRLTIQVVTDVLDDYAVGANPEHLRTGDMYLIAFNVTSPHSFERIQRYPQQILQAQGHSAFPILVVGHHPPRCPRRVVSHDEGAALARLKGCAYSEVIGSDAESFKLAICALVRQRWAWEKKIKDAALEAEKADSIFTARLGIQRSKSLLRKLKLGSSLGGIDETVLDDDASSARSA